MAAAGAALFSIRYGIALVARGSLPLPHGAADPMLLLLRVNLTPRALVFRFCRSGGCREYAARSRARAEGGGWPFGGDAGKLPPMEVRRFRWWEDAAAAEDEEGEVERRMAAKRRKRSVAELFAAVLRVARGRQGCGKGKAAKRKLGGRDNGKGKLVLKASNGKKNKKKKKAPAGNDVREKSSVGLSADLMFLITLIILDFHLV
ncbi:hypothetical protein HU200_026729 [Digitaria exilis]|uniref:Uncharacterized protein n=1 Tax=Digitaria exilis TaxID=1010633 RepID=A0A835BVD2_9POAL|nr:hypothetical protein HU200_026729 [Digitaria exilis]